MTKLERKIYNLLIQHTTTCGFHQKLWEVFKPYVFIHAECKAKDLANFIKKKEKQKE